MVTTLVTGRPSGLPTAPQQLGPGGRPPVTHEGVTDLRGSRCRKREELQVAGRPG